MARSTKVIQISGINIVTQPHTPETYIQLLKEVNQIAIPVSGNEHLMISGLRPHIENGDWLSGIEGEIVKFSNIDEHSQWINLTSGHLLEKGEEPEIPKNIRPNGALFPFIFYPKNIDGNSHKLFYISKSRNSHTKKDDTLSPNFVKKLFDKLFDNPDIKLKFDSIEVTVIPRTDALEQIFKLPKLNKLYLQITPPNPDDLEEMECKLLERYQRLNVKRVEETYIGNGDHIEPDEELKSMARIAAHNGFVQGTGKDSEGKTVELSTTQVPMKEAITVDNNTGAEREALRNFKL